LARHLTTDALNLGVALAQRAHIEHTVRRLVPERVRMRVRDRRGAATLIPVEELSRWYRSALDLLVERHGQESLGDYLEFGVFQGDSLTCMYRALQERQLDGVRIYGFDSFKGLPPIEHPEDRKLGWHQGQFASGRQRTLRRLEHNNVDLGRVSLVEGFYSDTLVDGEADALGIRKASVIMIDCDLYTSAKQALDFCTPLIKDEAVVFFDDWTHSAGEDDARLGEQRAFAEWLSENQSLDAREIGTYHQTQMQTPEPSKIFLVSR
jgi:O-methyltransferase